MASTLSKAFLVRVVAVTAPPAPPARPPAPTPAPTSQPAWLRGVPLFSWIDVPNSKMVNTESGKGLDPAYMAAIFAGTSQATPTRTKYIITWPENKYGRVSKTAKETSYYKTRYNFNSIGYDSGRYSGRAPNILAGFGDGDWPDNTVPRFVFGVDNPYWDIAIQGTHSRNYRNQEPRSPLEDPEMGAILAPGDDPRWYRHFDGTPRPGHSYFGIWVLEKDQLLIKVGAHQFYPADYGYSPDMVVGNLETGAWNTQNPSPLPSYSTVGLVRGDETPWKTKHPITEDIWGVYARSMGVFRRASKRWEALWSDPTGYGWDNAVGAVDWEHEYILGCSAYNPAPGRMWWTFPTAGSSPSRRQVQITGPYAAVVNSENVSSLPAKIPKVEGMLWCPDLQKFLWYKQTVLAVPASTGSPAYPGFPGNAVYTIHRLNETTFYVDKLAASGNMEPVPYREPVWGGVLNRFQYCHLLRGVFWLRTDLEPLKFMRTG